MLLCCLVFMKSEADTSGSWLQASGSLPLKDMPPSLLHTMAGINDVAVAGSYGYVLHAL